MKKTILLTLFFTFSFLCLRAQTQLLANPDSVHFVTNDIDNFWKAFGHFKSDSTINPFGPEYIDIGSKGVKGFINRRIQSADHLLAVVKKHQADYQKVMSSTLRIKEKDKQCRSTFYALKYLYPQAKFPNVYFVIGAYNTGGTQGADGLFIGSEMYPNVDNIPFIVAHELIHFQQTFPFENPTLLQQSVMEGSADFLGEMISGSQINGLAHKYGNEHKDLLCKEFVSKMNGTDFNDWLYGTSKKDDRPNDLGYWMGYQIVAQYYAKVTDKKQAIADILNIKDYDAFLKKSGYLDNYLK
ncbi:gliding motility protein GldB-related protein [Mucilaginibacter sp.]